ncbi:hypothetical protein [Thalassotalea maritima]|uniref:hypothetical protein n=1 Tax=Thalassotalea maritima TaxID=3242416 RepID=UPI00352821CC
MTDNNSAVLAQEPQEISFQEEMQREMVLQARKKVLEKKIFSGIQEFSRSCIHEKFYKVTNKGRKEYIQIQWRHFILREHEKDKDVITTVRQTKGQTIRGTKYVKDVDVQQTTIHYDYISAEDHDGNLHNFRLQDMQLDKLPRDHIITLGWVYHSKTNSDKNDVVSEGSVLGQNWDGELQPTIIVVHPQAESDGLSSAQWMKAEKFQDAIADNGIGFWHLAWLLPIASCFMMGARYFENVGFALSAIGIGVAGIVKAIRYFQLKKQMGTFSEWLSDEIKGFTSKSEGLMTSIISKLQ